LQHTYELLAAYGAFDSQESMLVESRQATPEELSLFHTEEYIEAERDIHMVKVKQKVIVKEG
jgi:acetoin utilization deacetylase AcuC-like enzyme